MEKPHNWVFFLKCAAIIVILEKDSLLIHWIVTLQALQSKIGKVMMTVSFFLQPQFPHL